MTTQERIAKFPVLVLQKVQLEKEYENIQKERDDFMKEWDVKFQKNRLHYNLICKELDDVQPVPPQTEIQYFEGDS